MLAALGWELEIALYLFTLQLHATLNAPQEHGDHPAINWSLLPEQERDGDSYWVKPSAAWFLNGPGGHLVACAWLEAVTQVGAILAPGERGSDPGQTWTKSMARSVRGLAY